MIQSFNDLYVAPNLADGAAIGNTTTETVLYATTEPTVFGTNDQIVERACLLWELWGRISNVVTAAPTMRWRVRWGGVAGVILCDSGAISASASAFTNAQWYMHGHLIVRLTGSGTSGSIMSQGKILTTNQTGTPTPVLMGSAGVLTPAAVGIDSTIDKLLSFTFQWGTANPSNTIQCITRLLWGMR